LQQKLEMQIKESVMALVKEDITRYVQQQVETLRKEFGAAFQAQEKNQSSKNK
jgi:hypothetical protein